MEFMLHCEDRITLSNHERQAMFRIPAASNDPLPEIKRAPVELDGDTVLVFDETGTECIGCEHLPVVEKAA